MFPASAGTGFMVMLTSRLFRSKKIMNSSEPANKKTWETIWAQGMLHMILLLLVVFFVEISTVKADGLFDFQMKLAEKGNAEAQLKVGEMYETGFGVKKDMQQARTWIEKSAAQGNETAGFKLLYWSMQKNGMKGENKARYGEMLKKAEAGNGYAMYYIGLVNASGAGVRVNYNKSLDWLNKATLIGILEAEREIGAVREKQQAAQVQARKAREQRKVQQAADKKAKLEDNKRKQAEAQRQQRAQKQQQADASAKASAAAAKKAEEARLLAERKAQAVENERKRRALLKKRAEDKQKKKQEFESDPCSGKSARFLSTCR